jgi:hypothetical protein
MLERRFQYRLFLAIVFLVGLLFTNSVNGAESTSDGSLKWKFQINNWVDSSPSIGKDGTIYVGSWDSNLYAINPDGSLKWKFEIDDWIFSSPAIGKDGTIYVGSWDGNLYAINSGSLGPADSPWPMFRHDVMHTGRFGNQVQLSSSSSSNSTDNQNQEITLSLVKGWNLKGTSHSIEISAFSNYKSEIIAVWKWNGNGWLFWSPNESLMDIAKSYGIDQIKRINAYDGFWVKVKDNVNISIPISVNGTSGYAED